ncbi:MAG: precorrin-3B synthase [Pseudomonadota bacterium]
MSAAPEIKGWCPGAHAPMSSGDGLVVRIRPPLGRLTPAQAAGVATLSMAHGNGIIELSSRANVQLRGVTPESHRALLDGLDALGLLDASADVEARRNVLVQPFWRAGDETYRFAVALTSALRASGAPQVPHKFGFVLDTGPQPVLRQASGDIRLERGATGDLIVVASGMGRGKPVTPDSGVAEMLALARWFLETRKDETRMARLLAHGAVPPPGFSAPRGIGSGEPDIGVTASGAMIGLPFGQLQAQTLQQLSEHGALRLTPWRKLLIEGARRLPRIEGVITDPADPLLRVMACPGTDGCTQAHVETRALARALAPRVPEGAKLHVSGCAKGCANPRPADLTVVGTDAGLSMVRNGRASDAPSAAQLTPHDIAKAL